MTSKRAASNSKVTETDHEQKSKNLRNPDRKTTGNVTLEDDNREGSNVELIPDSSHKVEESDDEDKILKEAPKKRG